MTRRHLAAVAILGGLVGLWISPGRAYAVPIEPADHHVTTLRVTYVEPAVGPQDLYVELNNGATYALKPCRVEDGRQCYWDADARGNGVGRSFVRVSGQLIYSTAVGTAR